jgi:hypothetical protein
MQVRQGARVFPSAFSRQRAEFSWKKVKKDAALPWSDTQIPGELGRNVSK